MFILYIITMSVFEIKATVQEERHIPTYFKETLQELRDKVTTNEMGSSTKMYYVLGCGECCFTSDEDESMYEIQPNDGLHVIVSNNIYAVWLEAEKIVYNLFRIKLIDDFVKYYDEEIKRSCYGQIINFKQIVYNYIEAFMEKKDEGFYARKIKAGTILE